MAASVIMTTTRTLEVPKSLENYDSFTKKCENYLSVHEDTAINIKKYIKDLYGLTKGVEATEGITDANTLPELIVDNFDEEQIWQELELQNEARLDKLVGDVAKLVARKDKFSALGHKSEEESLHSDEAEEDFDDEDVADDGGEGSDEDELLLESGSDVEDDDDRDKKRKNRKNKSQKFAGKPSVVDDRFFKLSEMEKFLEKEEREDPPLGSDDSSDESVDLFNDIPSDDDENHNDEDDEDEEDEEQENNKSDQGGNSMHYADFFDAPFDDGGRMDANGQGGSHDMDASDKSGDEQADEDVAPEHSSRKNDKKVRWDMDENELDKPDESDDSDSETTVKDGPKSSFEARQERLRKRIKQLEEEALSEKPWQLKGEIAAKSRPENALLEEALEFDVTTRPAPVMTEETTLRLEDVIKQRIKDRAWDDVERRQRPVEAPTEYKKRLVLDQEKSKISLAQVYEQEYLKQVTAADPEAADTPEEIPKEHQEIKTMVDSLFRKLDALSNFHFTPKQVAPEVKIVTNIPAINMEEVAPVATSEATLLAPEEVRPKPHGDVIGQAERTDTDKKRERRLKKKRQRVTAHEREKREAAVAKARPGLGNKYSKEKAVKMLEKISKDSNVNLIDNTQKGSTMKSSSAFFSQLQEEVSTHVKERSQTVRKRKKTNELSAKRLKL